jgi:hypothetical protein
MLFGHQNDDTKPADSPADSTSVTDAPAANPLATDPATGVSLPVVEDLEQDTTASQPVLNQPDATSVQASDDTPAVSDVAAAEPVSAPAPKLDDDLLQPSADDGLLNLKQEALQQLGPLVGHLDQTPEEKFRTTMMMIQSSDNPGLIKDAYSAAQQISDDKVRAQALLDIVNEINYFTHRDQAN